MTLNALKKTYKTIKRSAVVAPYVGSFSFRHSVCGCVDGTFAEADTHKNVACAKKVNKECLG